MMSQSVEFDPMRMQYVVRLDAAAVDLSMRAPTMLGMEIIREHREAATVLAEVRRQVARNNRRRFGPGR